MMAGNHLIGGTAVLLSGVSLFYAGSLWLGEAAGTAPMVFLGRGGDLQEALGTIVAMVMTWLATTFWLGLPIFWLGTLLPDIDSKKSTLGRYIHVPGPHRGLTHSNWVLMLLAVLAWFDPTQLTWWLLAGVATHHATDSWSAAGRVGFFPLGKHRIITFPDGTPCVVTTKRHRGLYKSGDGREALVMAGLVILAGGGIALAVFTSHTLGIPLLTT